MNDNLFPASDRGGLDMLVSLHDDRAGREISPKDDMTFFLAQVTGDDDGGRRS